MHSVVVPIFVKCGMRHPSSAKKEGDLSRLTTSSSSSTNDQNSIYLPESEIIAHRFSSTYLPEVIDPLEWQISRKRKERQDSTSSITQDRKLIRSNSEEYIPNVDYEVIRRVCSHEEFKHVLQDRTNENVEHHECRDRKASNNEVQEILKEAHKRVETSPARSRTFDFSHKHRISPLRDSRHGYKNNDEVDGENERRRNSERFCKARAPPGRRSQSSKKANKYLASKLRERDENVYKYDITVSKCERRGFVSISRQTDEKLSKNDLVDETTALLEQNETTHSSNTPKTKTTNESLPWEISSQDETPVVCPRFSGNTFDHVNQFRDSLSRSANAASNNGLKTLGNFTKVENLKTRELMQSIPSVNLLQPPDEKLKQINKRLIALKKRVENFEEIFQREHGYKPSHAEKMNDKYMKNAAAEIHKLRKEKQQIKSSSVSATGVKVSQNNGKKTDKLKDVLVEIEKRLQEKREEENRPVLIDDLSPEQLIQEKTAIQRGLLYIESLFGRPNTREERDAVRSLYDRYRVIKRTINRSATMSISGSGVSDLPTILEHEAMHFPVVIAAAPLVPLESPTDTSAEETLQSNESTTDTASSVHENVHTLSVDELWKQLELARQEKKQLRRTIKEFEDVFEEQNGRKMLKSDRTMMEETYVLYKQKKAKLRLLDALVKKHMAK
ncbi:Protein FAM13A [Pseudolycoriella hygida]|uniref:Protein FAM13A n=1 Tax=Pseudolycoriella hygida TaxID=35572 RepID=A0A9Q0N6L7_9DIPT|nr:Protein FAM13A [Pseudolycoriella hygida]